MNRFTKSLTDAYGKDPADEMIAIAGRVAFMGKEEIEEEIERLGELLKEVKG